MEFTKKGYNVVVTGRRMEKLETTVSLCEAEGATKHRVSYVQGEMVSICEAEGVTKDRVSYIQGGGGRYHCEAEGATKDRVR